MANVGNIVYLSNADYNTLLTTGTVTVNGQTITYSQNDVYVTPDNSYIKPATGIPDSDLAEAHYTETEANALLLNKADKTSLALTDKKLDYLSKLTKGQAWDTEAGTSPAYQQTVPSGAKCVAVNGVGGKTVVMNQLVDTISTTATGTVSVSVDNTTHIVTLSLLETGNASSYKSVCGVNVVSGHKYLMGCVGLTMTNGTCTIRKSGTWETSSVTYSTMTDALEIITANNSGSLQFFVDMRDQYINVSSLPLTVSFIPQLFDLTKMFGSGNEPSTVAQFRAMFPSDYYAYNAGTLLSANVTSINSRSQYTKVDLGTFDWSKNSSLNRFQTTSTVMSGIAKLPVDSSTVANIVCAKYGANAYSAIGDTNLKIGLSAGGTLAIRDDSYSTGTDLKASLSGVYLYYEPVSSTSAVSLGSLTIPQALRNEHPLHSAGSVYDEYDIENKKFIKRVGSVDLGTLTWTYVSGTPSFFYANMPTDSAETRIGGTGAITANYLIWTSFTSTLPNKYAMVNNNSLSAVKRIAIRDDSYTDAAAFKAAMSGVILYYELATPDDSQSIAEYFTDDNLLTVEAGGTLTFTQDNAVTSNLSIPNSTEYCTNRELAVEVPVTSSDNGKIMQVVNGAWAAVTISNANGVSF